MGVAVRYKQEDPWERIRLMAAATPNTPLQFMSTGFRFIAWDTASQEFMALVFRTLARNGIRRFCLADPMNDVDAQIASARAGQAGGRRIRDRGAGVFAEPHPRRCALRGERAPAGRLPGRGCAVHQGSGWPAAAAAGTRADSGHQGGDWRQGAGAARSLHHRPGGAGLHGRAGLRRQCAAVRVRRRGGWHVQSALRTRGFEPARAGTHGRNR